MLRRLAATLFALAACSAPGASTTDGRPGGGDGQPGGPDGRPGQADARPGTPDAPAGPNGLTIIVEPDGQSANELVDAINGATTSVYMTMYEIDDSRMLSARWSRARRPASTCR